VPLFLSFRAVTGDGPEFATGAAAARQAYRTNDSLIERQAPHPEDRMHDSVAIPCAKLRS
jgi:hypothetical protein